MSDINDALGLAGTASQPNTSNLNVGRKYPALRALSTILSIIAWLVAIFTVIVVITLFSNTSQYEKVSMIYPFIALVVGAILFIALLAYSEIIIVFVDIEENTRKSALQSSKT
jgi:hypothetical protein